MTILITGVAGFIGSNFLFYMMERYPTYEFIGVDKLTYAGNLSTLKGVEQHKNFVFYQADIGQKDKIETIFQVEKPSMVVNFAAESHVDRSIENPSIFLEANVMGTQVLLEACKNHGNIRFHQISTDEVYGDLPLDRPDLFFTEDTALHTSSPYSASKAAADLLVLAYFRTFHLPVTVSRCSNNYGPYHFPEKLIPLMIVNALRGKKLPIYGEGKNVRDWLYVKDHCTAVDKILHQGRMGEVYNIGGHNERTNIEVVQTIIDILGRGEMEFVADRKGHDQRYAIDPSKMQEELGWLPETRFEDGLQKTIDWYLGNQPWWEEILERND